MDFREPEANCSRQLRSYWSLANQDRVTLNQAVQAVVCASTLARATEASAKHAVATTSLDTMWNEAQTILVDSDQNLEDHLDFFMTIGQITTNQGPQDGFVQALGERFCQLNIASAQDHFTESAETGCSTRYVNMAAQHPGQYDLHIYCLAASSLT